MGVLNDVGVVGQGGEGGLWWAGGCGLALRLALCQTCGTNLDVFGAEASDGSPRGNVTGTREVPPERV